MGTWEERENPSLGLQTQVRTHAMIPRWGQWCSCGNPHHPISPMRMVLSISSFSINKSFHIHCKGVRSPHLAGGETFARVTGLAVNTTPDPVVLAISHPVRLATPVGKLSLSLSPPTSLFLSYPFFYILIKNSWKGRWVEG